MREAAFPDAGWEIRDRNDAAPGIRRFVEQVTMFLTLVGLTALGVGGVGAGQAIGAFLDRKRADIAILKTLGADGGLVFLIFFLQVMTIAIAARVLWGCHRRGAAFRRGWHYLARNLPAPPAFGLYPGRCFWRPVSAFCRPSLLRAAAGACPRNCRPPACSVTWWRPPARPRAYFYLAASAGAARSSLPLARCARASPAFAAEFLAGAARSRSLSLRLLAEGLRRMIARPAPSALAPAAAGAGQSGAARRGRIGGVVTALGLGLTLLATVTLLDRTIIAQVEDALPAARPASSSWISSPTTTAEFRPRPSPASFGTATTSARR